MTNLNNGLRLGSGVYAIPAAQAAAARTVVMQRAADEDEAARLLDMLGLSTVPARAVDGQRGAA